MKKNTIMFNIIGQINCFCLFGVIIMCVFIPMSVNASDIEKTVSLNLKNESLLNVLEEISKQSGWEVQVDKELANITVSGHYLDISLEELFRRLLRGKNMTLLIDDEERRLYVRTFGSKINDKSIVIIGRKDAEPYELEGMDMVRYEQNQEIKRRGQNPDYVDPMIGVANWELDEVLEKQNAAIKRRGQDPDYVDPVLGVTNSELSSTIKSQNEAIKERGLDPDYVDPMIGVTNSELSSTIKSQNEAIKERGKDPDYVDPLIGIPNSVLDETLAQQNEAIKSRGSKEKSELD